MTTSSNVCLTAACTTPAKEVTPSTLPPQDLCTAFTGTIVVLLPISLVAHPPPYNLQVKKPRQLAPSRNRQGR
jgi:hypothetical protein